MFALVAAMILAGCRAPQPAAAIDPWNNLATWADSTEALEAYQRIASENAGLGGSEWTGRYSYRFSPGVTLLAVSKTRAVLVTHACLTRWVMLAAVEETPDSFRLRWEEPIAEIGIVSGELVKVRRGRSRYLLPARSISQFLTAAEMGSTREGDFGAFLNERDRDGPRHGEVVVPTRFQIAPANPAGG